MKLKKMLIASLALVILGIGMLPALSGCQKKPDAQQETTPQPSETTSALQQEEESAAMTIYLVKGDKASEQISRLVDGAAKLITEQTGLAAEVVTDSQMDYEERADRYYVIFGDTAYEQSSALAADAEDSKIYYDTTDYSVTVYAKTEQLLSIGAEMLFANCVKDGAFVVDAEEYAAHTVDASGYVRENWMLNCPAFARCRLDEETYSTGYGIDPDKNCSYMHILRLGSVSAYTEYLTTLEEVGYRKEFENEIDGNLYASYIGPLGTNLYVYFTKAKFEIRVIEDHVSATLSDFNYKLEASSDSRLYAFKMGYKSEDCFLIHQADNSWIIMDGGNTGLTKGSAYVKDMYQFMVDRSDLADGEKLQIACWYLTHAHSDHFFGMYGLIHEYGENIEVHRIIDNTPVDGYFVLDDRASYVKLLQKIREQNPDVQYLKIHTGMVVELADTTIEILFTHEDFMYSYYIEKTTTNPNRASIVAVFDIAGMTMLETADNFVADVYKDFDLTTLTTDVLKIAHHYYDKTMDTLYKRLYNTGKVSYCFNPRLDTTANAENNYQKPTMELFGDRYLQGRSNTTYEFYRNGNQIVMNRITH